ncbi:Mariner Mos1 transposase [Eumeta japonica]|uniref:Mariner Mos1 transposase n=1 Tax=Eumeta variegata TaxID=151549 RepID=A0A4C1W2U5_EUMVA|nr:Mariner Mos1 transposase [Eumeta japonica]
MCSVQCVRWDWKDVIHYELLPPGNIISTDLYYQQLMKLKQEVEEKQTELNNRKGNAVFMCVTDNYNTHGMRNVELMVCRLNRDYKTSRLNEVSDRPDFLGAVADATCVEVRREGASVAFLT